MDRQRRAFRGARPFDAVGERHLAGQGRPHGEEEARDLGHGVVVELRLRHEAMADAERRHALGRAGRRAAERAAHDLEQFEQRRALGDGLGLGDRDEDRRPPAGLNHGRDGLGHRTPGEGADGKDGIDAAGAQRLFTSAGDGNITVATLSRGMS